MSDSQATYQDADLLLKLYDLRREPVMREARTFIVQFMPQSADDILENHASQGLEGGSVYTPGLRLLEHGRLSGEPWCLE